MLLLVSYAVSVCMYSLLLLASYICYTCIQMGAMVMEGYTLRIPPGLCDTFMNALFLESHSFQSVFCCHSLTTVNAGQTVLKNGVESLCCKLSAAKNAQFCKRGRHAHWLNWPIEIRLSSKPFAMSQLFFVIFQKHPII